MNVPYAIAIKLAAVLLLSLMSALIRAAGAKFPVGEIVFFRSAFAILPVVVIYAARGHLLAAISTARPFGHLGRGVMGIMSMFLNFRRARPAAADGCDSDFVCGTADDRGAGGAAAQASMCAPIAGLRVSLGFVGVLVMLWPYLDIGGFVLRGRGPHRGCDLRHDRLLHQRRHGDSNTSPDRQRDDLLDRAVFLADLRAGWPRYLAVRVGDAELDRAHRPRDDRRARRALAPDADRELPLRAGLGGGAVRLHRNDLERFCSGSRCSAANCRAYSCSWAQRSSSPRGCSSSGASAGSEMERIQSAGEGSSGGGIAHVPKKWLPVFR